MEQPTDDACTKDVPQSFLLSSQSSLADAGCLSQLDVARFAKRYPAVMTTLLRSIMEVTVKYYKALLG